MNKAKAFVVVLTALLLHACTTAAPTYRNPTPSPYDAELSFESDFELHTHFSINTQRGSSCGKFETVGQLLKANSIFIYDRPNKEIKVMVPTGKSIGVSGYHYFSDPGYRSNCYPGGHFFTPERNQKYVVKMNVVNEAKTAICFISIGKVDADGSLKPVAFDVPPACTKEPTPRNEK